MATAPLKYKLPLNNISGAQIAGNIVTLSIPALLRVGAICLELQATKSALGGSTKGFPLVSDACGQIQVKVGGNPIRTRLASELFGATGLNALCDANAGGMVTYTQAGNNALSTIPVLIGSAADVAQQALLTGNTATVGTFQLPIQFAEPFRKEYAMTDALCLTQVGADGTNIGAVTVEITLPANANIINPVVKGYIEYDLNQAPSAASGKIFAMKEYRFTVPYTAAGDLECGLQLPLKDALNRVSLLTVGDNITRVVVKQGQTVIRDIFYPRSVAELIRKDYNVNAMVTNRFDIELDENDDPTQSLVMNPNLSISIVATLATNNGTNLVVLPSYYGPVS